MSCVVHWRAHALFAPVRAVVNQELALGDNVGVGVGVHGDGARTQQSHASCE